jgi:predicted HicB family RNase H-like nuclease
MNSSDDRYTYRISWSEDDKEYVGLCIEFPSLSWLAKSPEDALRGIRNIINETVIDMRNDGEVPPAPLSGRTYSGKFIVRIPPETHRELALKAAEDGISLNRLISVKLAK